MQVGHGSLINNCTVYNCTTGIYDLGSKNTYGMLNTTVSDCTDGFLSNNAGVVVKSAYFDYNNWYNNTHDISWDDGTSEDNSAKGVNATANNPSFTNAAAGDFSLGGSSSLLDAGFSTELGIG